MFLPHTSDYLFDEHRSMNFAVVCGPQSPPPSIPAAPSNVVATALSQYAMQLTWQDNSNNETGFNIDNGCPVGYTGCHQGATLAATTGANTTSVTFSTTPGAYQCFRVQAFNSAGGSAWTSYGCTTTPSLAIPATQAWTDTGVDLNGGDWVQISASGTIKIAASDPGTSPQGDPNCSAPATFSAPPSPAGLWSDALAMAHPSRSARSYPLWMAIDQTPELSLNVSSLTPGRAFPRRPARGNSLPRGSLLVSIRIGTVRD